MRVTGSLMLAGLLIVVLMTLAALHAYWGLGGVWPASDRISLAQTIIGTRRGHIPGLGPSLFVTGCLLAVAVFVAWRAGWFPALGLPVWLWGTGFFGATTVFAGRGIAGFIPAVFRYAEGSPFYRLNLIFYSPLCLAIAAGMIALWALTRRV
jgi:hypothetical protein